MSEHDEQCKVIAWARDPTQPYYGCSRWLYAVPNAARRTRRMGAYMKAEGMLAGVLDLFLPVPMHGLRNSHWCGLYVEMKFGNNKLSSEQVRFAQWANTRYAVLVEYSSYEAIDHIIRYLKGQHDYANQAAASTLAARHAKPRRVAQAQL